MTRRLLPLVMAVGLLASLAACGGGDSSDVAAQAANASTASVVAPSTETPTTTAAPSSTTTIEFPVSYGAAVLVAGREDCDLDDIHAAWTTDADGTWLIRDGWFECEVTNIDPRIAGTAHYTLNMDQWAPSDQHLAQVMWGEIEIVNDGGAWQADYVGVFSVALGDVFTALFTGSGDYAGLSYYQWAVETYGNSWPTKGLIFPSVSAMP